MFSVIVLMAVELSKSKVIKIMNSAWYHKPDAAFSDIIAFVRRHIWYARNYTKSSDDHDLSYFQNDFLESILDIVCYAA